MTYTPFTLLYVADPLASAQFYAQLLEQPALEASPGFAMFAMGPGAMLGLWRRDDVQPAAEAAPGASELALSVPSSEQVHSLHARWQALGWKVLQPPTAMDFGLTFTVQDPDGHRVRVFTPQGA